MGTILSTGGMDLESKGTPKEGRWCPPAEGTADPINQLIVS